MCLPPLANRLLSFRGATESGCRISLRRKNDAMAHQHFSIKCQKKTFGSHRSPHYISSTHGGRRNRRVQQHTFLFSTFQKMNLVRCKFNNPPMTISLICPQYLPVCNPPPFLSNCMRFLSFARETLW